MYVLDPSANPSPHGLVELLSRGVLRPAHFPIAPDTGGSANIHQLPPPAWSAWNPFSSGPSYGQPRPASGGVAGWFNDRLRAFKNRGNRTATGAYESSFGARGARGLDPDDAWDARVGHETDAYGHFEEQELQNTHTGYDGSSYNMNLAATPGMAPSGFGDEENQRGRTLSRSPGLPSQGLAVPGRRNPFDDDAEPSTISLRGVSPRPIDTAAAAEADLAARKAKGGNGSADSSPTERKSIFRENV